VNVSALMITDTLYPGGPQARRGLAFMLGGHMFCSVVNRTSSWCGSAGSADRALGQPLVRPMDFTGRAMNGMVFVDPAGLRGGALPQWVDAAAGYVRGLPPKPAAPRSRKRW